METICVHGTTCRILNRGDGPWLYWMTRAGCEEELHQLDDLIRTMTDVPYTLAAMEADDWNRAYSPWPAPAAFGKADFPGGGAHMLQSLTEWAGRSDGGSIRYVGGYSLAGLFSLWALYSGAPFQGAASCSGSLWYPGWQAWQAGQKLPEGCSVYLSLGTREEKTRNRCMAQVGDATRAQYEALTRDSRVGRTTLVWNEGGHFNDPTLRMARGFAWLLNA